MISNQGAAFNSCVKVLDNMQDHIKTLFSDMNSKGKSSRKTEKVLNELKDLSVFQQNVIFALGKFMQHMADTFQDDILTSDSYLEYLKPGVTSKTHGMP